MVATLPPVCKKAMALNVAPPVTANCSAGITLSPVRLQIEWPPRLARTTIRVSLQAVNSHVLCCKNISGVITAQSVTPSVESGIIMCQNDTCSCIAATSSHQKVHFRSAAVLTSANKRGNTYSNVVTSSPGDNLAGLKPSKPIVCRF
jgi:hypothetical protein